MKLKKIKAISYKNYINNKKWYGWTNRETWLFLLWLEADEKIYKYIQQAINNDIDDETKRYHLWNILEEFRDIIRDEVATEDGVVYDLVNQALARVNYRELLNGYLE